MPTSGSSGYAVGERQLQAAVDFMPEHNEWWASCVACGWVSAHSNSGAACDAADFHDVEVHNVLAET